MFWSTGQSPATREDVGRFAPQAGLHAFTLGHHNAYGPMEPEVYVQDAGLERQRIPASMLFRSAAGASSIPVRKGR